VDTFSMGVIFRTPDEREFTAGANRDGARQSLRADLPGYVCARHNACLFWLLVLQDSYATEDGGPCCRMVAGSVAMRWRAAQPTEHNAVTHHVGNWVMLQKVVGHAAEW
jgi:hypothetical protein